MKKLLLGSGGVVLVLAGVAFFALKVPAVQDVLLDRAVNSVVSSPAPSIGGEDEMTLVMCGSGGPFPDPARAGPCALVAAGDKMFLVDTGTGGAQRLGQYRVPMGPLDGIFYTHLHSDHISGLGDVALNSWAGGRATPLTLYGPPGTELLAAGTQSAFTVDSKARIDHHGSDIFAPQAQAITAQIVTVPTRDDLVTVFDDGDLTVRAFRVTHVPLADAYGYRFDYKGRSIIFSGDTVRDENMVRFGKDTDVMVHEAMGMRNINTIIGALRATGADSTAKILQDASEVHTAPVDVADVANEADTGLLIFNHIVPPMPVGLMKDVFMRGVPDVRSEDVILGYDGLVVRLPVGADGHVLEDLN
ncbi:MAG: MBL fold metallo-hydrolase [Parvibaculaceae bacterium]